MTTAQQQFIIGWQEWVALPELGLPAIKAKIDTGARTSALHAFQIEPFGPASQPMVRFGVHPIPGRRDIAVFCSAPVADRREVTSSNGEKETRLFIRTEVMLGERSWPIEIGLTNRESMTYRMLLGRLAIRDDMMVDAATSFRQPRLSYRLYRGMPRLRPVDRPLRIALIARDPDAPTNRRLAETADERGHVLEALALDRIELSFRDAIPGLALDGVPLAHYDAVVPRVGRKEGAVGAAVVRQLELMGSLALNPGDAIDRVSNRLAAAQALARHHLQQTMTDEKRGAGAGSGAVLRTLVIGGAASAMTSVMPERVRNASLAGHRAERRLAEHAAAALGLGLAAIDIEHREGEVAVAAVSARPALGRFERHARADVATPIIETLEERLRSVTRADLPGVAEE